MAENTTQPNSEEESRLLNQAVFEKLGSDDHRLQKQAIDAVNDYTRFKLREDGFYNQIQPALPIADDQLDRQADTDKPVKIVDLEPGSPAAISIPFATLPQNLYIEGPRYPVMFDRITTPKFTKDVDELRTWHMDIRQVFSDNAIKDMLAEKDGKFIRAVNSAIVGPGATVPTSGTVQHEQISGGITRDTLWDGLKILPNTPSNLHASVVLCNNITIHEVGKFARNEMGGDLAQDVMREGWTLQEFMGRTWIITIKKGLVPTNTLYYFGDPNFLGKHYELEEPTMYIRREAYMLESFLYTTCGGAIGNTSSVARADFN